MPYNLVTNIETCYITVPHLLYYSHIPTAIIALLFGFFVFLKTRKNNTNNLSAKILFFIAILFSFWAIFDIILFLDPDSRLVMFVWSIINLVEMLVSVGTLYFAYVFLEQKDAPLHFKIKVAALLLPFIVFIPTRFNIPGFDIVNCEAEQGIMIYYFYALEILFFLEIFPSVK